MEGEIENEQFFKKFPDTSFAIKHIGMTKTNKQPFNYNLLKKKKTKKLSLALRTPGRVLHIEPSRASRYTRGWEDCVVLDAQKTPVCS